MTLTQQSYPQYAHVPAERHNPVQFAKDIMDVLLANKGQRVHIEEAVGGDPWTINEVVLKLRRIGWVIDGEKGVPGYTLVDILPPPPWLRLAPPKQATIPAAKTVRSWKPSPMQTQITETS
jgi:hypothetical protein